MHMTTVAAASVPTMALTFAPRATLSRHPRRQNIINVYRNSCGLVGRCGACRRVVVAGWGAEVELTSCNIESNEVTRAGLECHSLTT